MKRIMTVAIETMFMLTLFAAGWFALVVFQLLTNPIPHGNIGSKMRTKYNDAKRIENAYDEWNDTLRELGYGDLV